MDKRPPKTYFFRAFLIFVTLYIKKGPHILPQYTAPKHHYGKSILFPNNNNTEHQ